MSLPSFRKRRANTPAQMLLHGSLAALMAMGSASCLRERASGTSSSGDLPDSGNFDRRGLLTAIGQCALSQYGNLKTSLHELGDAATALAAATPEANTTERDRARNAWLAAIAQWQQTESFVIGPLAPVDSGGGQDLRGNFYAWPLDARCAVEQAIATKAYERADFGTTSSIAARGLSALEYLLFYDGVDNACGPDDSINKNAQWPTVASELRARKIAYAKVAALDLQGRGDALVAAWEPTQGNFLGEFTSAGHGSKAYDTDLRALSAVGSAITLLSLSIKDGKLGEPAGVVKCTQATCPDMLESKFAKVSRDHVKNNYIGMRRVLFGCAADQSGLGIDDLLVAIGAGDFAKRLRTDVDSVVAKVDALPDASLEQSLQSNLASVKAARTAAKLVDTDLKVEMKTDLNLTLPRLVEGDND